MTGNIENKYAYNFLSEISKTHQENNDTQEQIKLDGQFFTINIAGTNPDGGGSGSDLQGREPFASRPESRVMNALGIKNEKNMQALLTNFQKQGISEINVVNGQIKSVVINGKTVNVKSDFFKTLLKMLEKESLDIADYPELENKMNQAVDTSLNETESPIDYSYWKMYQSCMQTIMEVNHDAVERFVKDIEEQCQKMMQNLKILAKIAAKKMQEKHMLEKKENKNAAEKMALKNADKEIMQLKLLMVAIMNNLADKGYKIDSSNADLNFVINAEKPADLLPKISHKDPELMKTVNDIPEEDILQISGGLDKYMNSNASTDIAKEIKAMQYMYCRH